MTSPQTPAALLGREIAQVCIEAFRSQRYPASQDPTWTVLAGIVLQQDANLQVVSLATGVKCLPPSQITPFDGCTVHDAHAEILARRGFLRYLLGEVAKAKCSSGEPPSSIFNNPLREAGEKLRLRPGIRFHMYVSKAPCGDASQGALAQRVYQEQGSCQAFDYPPMSASREDAGAQVARGRQGFHLVQQLRTKPGRADAESTLSLSCSDKMARWTVLGLQGALLGNLVEPMYLDMLVIADDYDEQALQRCFRERMRPFQDEQQFPDGYRFHPLCIVPAATSPSSSDDCLFPLRERAEAKKPADICTVWFRETLPKQQQQQAQQQHPRLEILVKGVKQGRSVRRHQDLVLRLKAKSQVSKRTLWEVYGTVQQTQTTNTNLPDYHACKQHNSAYQQAKRLFHRHAPFSHWLLSGGTERKCDRFGKDEHVIGNHPGPPPRS